MKAWLRSSVNKVKPHFLAGGAQQKWFPIFDAIENFIFSSTKKTPTHQEIRMLNGGLVPFAQGTK